MRFLKNERLADWPSRVDLGHGQTARRCRLCRGEGIGSSRTTRNSECPGCDGAGFRGACGRQPTSALPGTVERQVMYRIRAAQHLRIWNDLDGAIPPVLEEYIALGSSAAE